MKIYINAAGKIIMAVTGAVDPEPKNTTKVEVQDIPELEDVAALKWDGKKVVLDPTYKPPKPVDINKVLAKKIEGLPLSKEEAAEYAKLKKEAIGDKQDEISGTQNTKGGLK